MFCFHCRRFADRAARIRPLPVAQADATLRTFGTMGKEVTPLRRDKEAELFQHEGKGCLKYMWFGGGWKGCEKTRIRIYVDGEANASIDMELYLGHGIGFGDESAPWGVARIGKTGGGANVYDRWKAQLTFDNNSETSKIFQDET